MKRISKEKAQRYELQLLLTLDFFLILVILTLTVIP